MTDSALATPLADRVRQWVALADVLADPDQHGERGVWARASDLLVAAERGDAVTATWGDIVWLARLEEAPSPQVRSAADGLSSSSDPESIWLAPLGPAVRADDLRTWYPLPRVVADLSEAMLSDAIAGDISAEHTDRVVTRAMAAIAPILRDQQVALEILVTAVQRDRRIVQRLLGQLADIAGVDLARLFASTDGRIAWRLARWPSPDPTEAPDPRGGGDAM